ncbi:nose resistant to fluoxetine protein 6-like [Glandiceps talaboti]
MSKLKYFLTATVVVLFNLYTVECQIEAIREGLKEKLRTAEQWQELSKIEDFPTKEEMIGRIKTFLSDGQAESYNVSAQCRYDTDMTVSDWPDQTYARQMFVSFGDLPEILREYQFTLNGKTYGSYGLCRSVEPDPGVRSFGGKYFIAYPIGIHWGVCFPDSCNMTDVILILNQGAGVPFDNGYCPEDIAFRTGDYIAIVICSIIAGLMVLGTGYDVIWQRKLKRQLKRSLEIEKDGNLKQTLIDSKMTVEELKKKKPGYLGQFLISFSVVTNGRKLLSAKKGGSSSISALNGIRVISMLWIMLGHSIQFGDGFYDNRRYLYQIVLPRFSFMAVFQAVLAVDTFFVLSGCLVAYIAMKQLYKTKGKLNWLLFYFHRWWRLTPAFGLTLLLWSTLILHIGNGPEHTLIFSEYTQQYCQDYWWAALFYFHNLYPWPGDLNVMCMGWTWYLQADMQLYIISPIFLILLYKSFAVGTSVVAFFTVASICVVASLATYYGYPIGGLDITFYNDNLESTSADYIYSKPYSRLQVYMVGIFLGYVLSRLDGKQIKLNKFINLLCWALAVGVGLTLLYGLYPTADGAHPDQWLAVLYQSTNRFIFAVVVAWVIFACATGNGGPINTLLSWSAWIPLARLTYCAYLVHPMVMFLYYWSLDELIHYTDITAAYIYIAHVVISYLVAFVISLAIESPMIGLEKLIFRR